MKVLQILKSYLKLADNIVINYIKKKVKEKCFFQIQIKEDDNLKILNLTIFLKPILVFLIQILYIILRVTYTNKIAC